MEIWLFDHVQREPHFAGQEKRQSFEEMQKKRSGHSWNAQKVMFQCHCLLSAFETIRCDFALTKRNSSIWRSRLISKFSSRTMERRRRDELKEPDLRKTKMKLRWN